MDSLHSNKQKGFFDAIPSQTSFWLGFVSAILVIGTVGFILLGAYILKGGAVTISGSDKEVAADEAGNQDLAVDANPSAPSAPIPTVNDSDHILGDKDAEITLITYTDFECPYCGNFHPTGEQVVEEYDGKVRWVYRHFPLSFHPEAEPAASAAECAAEQGKFWEYAEALFENQDQLSSAYYEELAEDLKLNVGDFNDCVESQKYVTKVRQQASDGAAAGVSGTPGSFLIDKDGNIQGIKGALPFATVKGMIDEVL